jgi:PAP2 superfamily
VARETTRRRAPLSRRGAAASRPETGVTPGRPSRPARGRDAALHRGVSRDTDGGSDRVRKSRTVASDRLTSTPGSGLQVLRRAVERGLRRGLVREVVLVAGAMLLYFGVRNLTVGSAAHAFENGYRLFDLERSLRLDWEEFLQGLVIGREALVDLSNWVYIWGHWPVILPTAVCLFLFRRHHYYLLRNAIFVSGAIGFLFFAVLPVAPPRLLDLGLVDTVTAQSEAYRALQPPGLTNQYAAFPSLHFGWNALVGVTLFRVSRNPAVRAFAVLSPVAMALAVVTTANHFLIDVVAGGIVVLIGWRVASRLERGRPQLD